MIKKLSEMISQNSTVTIAIKKTSDTTAVVMTNIKDINGSYSPIVINGNIDEIEKEFFNIISEPIKRTTSLAVEKSEFDNSLKEAKAALDEKKKTFSKKGKAKAEKDEHNEVLKENSPKDDKTLVKQIKDAETMLKKKQFIEAKKLAVDTLEKVQEEGNKEKLKTVINAVNEKFGLNELPESVIVSKENLDTPKEMPDEKPVDSFDNIQTEESEDINISFEGF